jgi:hypothetical protein
MPDVTADSEALLVSRWNGRCVTIDRNQLSIDNACPPQELKKGRSGLCQRHRPRLSASRPERA